MTNILYQTPKDNGEMHMAIVKPGDLVEILNPSNTLTRSDTQE